MVETQQFSFQLILHSGNARSTAYEALASYKAQDKVNGALKLEEAKKELIEAQKLHAELLRKMANEEDLDLDLLLIHAEDHISSSAVAVEMTSEMIELYQKLEEIKQC